MARWLEKFVNKEMFVVRSGENYRRSLEAGTDAGLKGYQHGGAGVSSKHAGFVVNLGGATAADVRAVISHVQDEVERQFGVRLEPELRFLG